jgi:glycosyltransferase involved in cell wall biosynthesis
MSKPRFVISSPFDTYSGYGSRSRDIIKAIIELDKYEVQLLPQRWGSTAWGFCKENPEWEFLIKHLATSEWNKTKPDIWMQITIPNEFQPVGKYNIGCTAGIESTACKAEWVEGLNRMDMNWVSSKHSKKVFESMRYERKNNQTGQTVGTVQLQKPMHVIFEGVNLDIYKPLKQKSLINLDNVKENFNYLFVGHWMSGEMGHDRKNVGLMVKAFYETFKNKKQKPGLIMKTSVGVESHISKDTILKRIKDIRESVNSDDLPNIYLINGSFSDEDINGLYNHSKVKAMVSLTKGEGYGRPLLEFSLTGKPIIATNFSGHTDFLHKNFTTLLPGELENVHKSAANDWLIPESQWFKVSTPHVGQSFTDVFKKYSSFKTKSKQQLKYSKSNFGYEKMKELVGNVLNSNIPDFPKQVSLSLPTLKKTQPKVELPKLTLPKLTKTK